MGLPVRRTHALRKGRISQAGARYFLTICACRPEEGLICPPLPELLSQALSRLEADGDLTIMASTIMPDHIHLLAILSGRLSISRTMGKLKSLTAANLHAQGVQWQDNFFEHRLRPEEHAGHYARYVFLNPYRAALIHRKAEWPWWRRSAGHEYDFLGLLEDGLFPPHEWLTMDDEALGVTRDGVGED